MDRLKTRFYQILILFSFLFVLKILGGSYLPSALEVAKEFTYLITNKQALQNLFKTASRVYISVLLALIVGVLIGAADYFSHTVSIFLNSLFYPIQFISEAVLVITIIAVMGLNDIVIYLVTVLVILPDIFVATQIGIENIDQEMLELGSLYTDDTLTIFRNIVLPQINPYIFAGLIRGHATAWEIVATAEVFLALDGIGYLIQNQYRLLNLPNLFALVMLLTILALISDRILRKIESYFTNGGARNEFNQNQKLI